MRNIVATIQSDQYRIISRPSEATTIVQGGPGTGKTAVGLHRAALLLYRHRDALGSARILVVGPNPLFMQYIAYVLPSLGETADQVAVDDLPSVTVKAVDDPLVARIKGDPRMAEVMRRAIADRVRPQGDDLPFVTGGVRFVVRATSIADLIGEFDPRRQSYIEGRDRFRAAFEQLVGAEYATAAQKSPGAPPVLGNVRGLPEFERALNRTWPTLTASELVRQLLSSEERIERAAGDVLSDVERRLLYRKPVERLEDVQWTSSDGPLVDEAQALIDHRTRRYGHVVLDEAQDLTPMQLRMVGRRIRDAATTVLGDLAQATGLWNYSSWNEVAQHLGVASTADVEELTLAYRVPQEIMKLALPVLKLTAPAIHPPLAFRPGGEVPSWIQPSPDDRVGEVVDRAAIAHSRGGTTAILAPRSLEAPVRAELVRREVDFGDADQGELSETIELLDPTLAKGLEFDHVVLVEPAAIIREAGEGRGHRELYVALTRATRTLTCVHAEPLPWPLVDLVGGETPDRAEAL
jgi:DNA helicase IV